MLMPKRAKYRKVQRGRMTGVASRGNKVSYGEFGIQALEPGWITGNQIEAATPAHTAALLSASLVTFFIKSAIENSFLSQNFCQ